MGPPLAKMTLSEFLIWEEQQADRHEFYRGEVFAMVGGTARHNRVILNVAGRLGQHLDGSPCQVFAEGMKVQVADGSLYPDVLVTCGKAEAGDEKVVTDPVLVIEVLSPSTMGYDKRDKFALYRSLPSLREYALIDPANRQVEVFTKADAGAWLFTDQSDAENLVLRSLEVEMPMDGSFKGVEQAA
jgi:Uma2 family endonuclease